MGRLSDIRLRELKDKMLQGDEEGVASPEIIKEYLDKGYHCIGEYKGERVRIEGYDRDGFTIFMPSRQASVYIPLDKVELLKAER